MEKLDAGYDKVPQHASIARRKQAALFKATFNFVLKGRDENGKQGQVGQQCVFNINSRKSVRSQQ